ncbi:MAG: ATP-binding protein [Methanocorpusculum sp.]|nr:ATP-binding protein [Methanocorpusculum sp.]
MDVERLITEKLRIWKENPKRKPLLLRGVRQCGKTWILRNFGEQYFSDTAYFTFENNHPLSACFNTDMNPERILRELSLLHGKALVPGKTLVIFDEIQFCPNALTSLKYFSEEMPALHIACAGSYLGIHLAKSAGSFPVGKVDFLTLHPLNFEEYLLANGEESLRDFLISAEDSIPSSIMGKLESLYREYLITGGMPEAVSSWVESHDIVETDTILRSIINSYEADFLKYAPRDVLPKLTLIWRSIPNQLAKDNHKFIFSHVKKGLKARDLEDALYWLVSAGIILQVLKVEKPAVPLSVYADVTNFKIYLCDVGLLRTLAGFPASGVSAATPVVADMRGALTENFAAEELTAVLDSPLYFWKRGAAEVEFVVQNELAVIPVEVKAAKNTTSRSLSEYRKAYLPALSVRTSLKGLSRTPDETGVLLSLPLYLLWRVGEIFSRV